VEEKAFKGRLTKQRHRRVKNKTIDLSINYDDDNKRNMSIIMSNFLAQRKE